MPQIGSRSRLSIREGPNYLFTCRISGSRLMSYRISIILRRPANVIFYLDIVYVMLFILYLMVVVFFDSVVVGSRWLASVFVDFKLMYLFINFFKLKSLFNLLLDFA